MSSSWADSGNRPTRPTYVPPHQRSDFAFTPHDSFHRNRARGGGANANPRRPPKPHSPNYPRVLNPNLNQNPYPNPNPPSKLNAFASPFEVADQLGGLALNDAEEATHAGGGINFDAYEDIPVETSGNDVPKAVSTFAEIDLGEALNENIRRCKYVKPTPVQRFAIPIAVAGRDLMACAQTGSGKTAAFCFPIISGIMRKQRGVPMRGGMARGGSACPLALILSPTRELSIQIHEEIKKFSYQTGVRAVVAYGGAPMHQQLRELDRGVDILVATPGRLVDLIERARVSLRSISYLALDEADRMLDMGFEHQIRKIVEQMGMPCPGARQTMLFSATFPSEIQRLASDFLSNYIFLAVGRVGSSTGLIEQRVEFVEDMNKRSYLMDLLHGQQENGTHGKQTLTLVFVETKRGADALEHWLSVNGFPATAIHGDKVQQERERALRSFKNGQTPILVATDVAARGLDIPHVAHVINFDLPKDIDDYVHRIGRTGRAGKSGLATAFFNDANHPMAKALAELMEESNQVVPQFLSEYAQRPSYGGGRSRRYGGGGGGGGRFGAYDFRRDSSSGGGGYYSSSYGTDNSSAYPYSAPEPAPQHVAAPTPTPAPFAYDYGADQIVATGWD